jgi:hypothetical protein
MTTAGANDWRRVFRAAAAALVLALLLSRLTTAPAAAQTERQAAGQAQDFIDWCFSVGGEPHAYGSTLVQCYIPSGSGGIMMTCDFYPERDCLTVSGPPLNPPFVDGTAPPLVRPPAGLGYHGGHGTLQFNGGGSPIGQTGQPGGTTLHTASASGHDTGMADKHAGAHGHGGQTPKGHHGHGGKK